MWWGCDGIGAGGKCQARANSPRRRHGPPPAPPRYTHPSAPAAHRHRAVHRLPPPSAPGGGRAGAAAPRGCRLASTPAHLIRAASASSPPPARSPAAAPSRGAAAAPGDPGGVERGGEGQRPAAASPHPPTAASLKGWGLRGDGGGGTVTAMEAESAAGEKAAAGGRESSKGESRASPRRPHSGARAPPRQGATTPPPHVERVAESSPERSAATQRLRMPQHPRARRLLRRGWDTPEVLVHSRRRRHRRRFGGRVPQSPRACGSDLNAVRAMEAMYQPPTASVGNLAT